MSDSHTDDTSNRNSCQEHLQKLQNHGEHVSNLLQVIVTERSWLIFCKPDLFDLNDAALLRGTE